MRRSCLTSKFVWVVLVASVCLVGEWFFSRRTKFDSGFKVMAVYEVSWRGPKVINRFTGIRKRVVKWWKRPFWFSKKINVTFSLNWSPPYRGGCSQFLISSKKFHSSICDWKNKLSLFGKYHLFRIESFRVDFWCVHRLQLIKVSYQYVTLQVHPAYRANPRNNPSKTFLSKLMDSWLVLRNYRVILNQWTKWNNRSLKWLPKTSFIRRLPIRQ